MSLPGFEDVVRAVKGAFVIECTLIISVCIQQKPIIAKKQYCSSSGVKHA